MLRTDRMNVTPLGDPATAVVTSMDTGNVDTVLIAGRLMKQGGRLLHVDWPAVHRRAVGIAGLRDRQVGLQAAKDLAWAVADLSRAVADDAPLRHDVASS